MRNSLLPASVYECFVQTLATSSADLQDDRACMQVLLALEGDLQDLRVVARFENWTRLVAEAGRRRRALQGKR